MNITGTIKKLTAPNGQSIRLVANGTAAVKVDFGPGCGRTDTFADQIVRNNLAEFAPFHFKAPVGNRIGWVLNAAGVELFAEKLSAIRDRSDANETARLGLLNWIKSDLLPEMKKTPEVPKQPASLSKVVIDALKGRITVELSDGSSTVINF